MFKELGAYFMNYKNGLLCTKIKGIETPIHERTSIIH